MAELLLSSGLGISLTCLILFMGFKFRWFRARITMGVTNNDDGQSTFMTGTYRSVSDNDTQGIHNTVWNNNMNVNNRITSVHQGSTLHYKSMPDLRAETSSNGHISTGNNGNTNSYLHTEKQQNKYLPKSMPNNGSFKPQGRTIHPRQTPSPQQHLTMNKSTKLLRNGKNEEQLVNVQGIAKPASNTRQLQPPGTQSPSFLQENTYHASPTEPRERVIKSNPMPSSTQPKAISSNVGHRNSLFGQPTLNSLNLPPHSPNDQSFSLCTFNDGRVNHRADRLESLYMLPDPYNALTKGSQQTDWTKIEHTSPRQKEQNPHKNKDKLDKASLYTAPLSKMGSEEVNPTFLVSHEYNEYDT